MYQENNKPRVTLHDKTFELSIPYAELDKAITALGDKINEDYKDVDTPLFLGVLSGAFMFMSELMQKINFPCELSFVKLDKLRELNGVSIDEKTLTVTAKTEEAYNKVQELIGLRNNIEGRHVIIVEDIVDTGESMEHLLRSLEGHRPASVEIATLLFKPSKFTKDYNVKYRAMDIPNDFIVGFGLDYDELGRNLKDIYTVVNE